MVIINHFLHKNPTTRSSPIYKGWFEMLLRILESQFSTRTERQGGKESW